MTAKRTGKRGTVGDMITGTALVHTVIDDHSRVAYAEIHDDETAVTAIAVLRQAVSWFAARGVTVERVLFDNGSAYRSFAWRDACAELSIGSHPTISRLTNLSWTAHLDQDATYVAAMDGTAATKLPEAPSISSQARSSKCRVRPPSTFPPRGER